MLLTVVAFKLVVADKLPKLAYSTRLDTYIDLCFICIFAIAAEAGLAFYVTDGEGYSSTGDYVGMVLCGVLWVLTNAHFVWCWWKMSRFVAKVLGEPITDGTSVKGIDELFTKLEEKAKPE